MHWLSWWYIEPIWDAGSGSALIRIFSLAVSLAVPVVAVLLLLLALDPLSILDHALVVLCCFAFVACLGHWTRQLQQKALGWASFITALMAAVLAFTLCARARNWHRAVAAQGPAGPSLMPECMGLRQRPWLTRLGVLDGRVHGTAAGSARALATCCIGLPSCVLAFIGGVHGLTRSESRSSRPEGPSLSACCSACTAALLGSVVVVYLHWPPPETPHEFGVALLRWFAFSLLCSLAAIALRWSFRPLCSGAADLCSGCCCGRAVMMCVTLCVLLTCAYLGAALQHSSLSYLQLTSLEAAKAHMKVWLHDDAKEEAMHVLLFLVVIVPLFYVARTSYWRRHFHKRWQLTPLDHQGLFGVQGLLVSPESQAWKAAVTSRTERQLTSDAFFQRNGRHVFGSRAKLLHLGTPLKGLGAWRMAGPVLAVLAADSALDNAESVALHGPSR